MAKKTSIRSDYEYLKKLAKAGAEATLHRLREEIAVLERTFPELSTAKGRRGVAAAAGKRAGRMTAAGRKVVSERMKKYWAERRRQAAAGKTKKG